jgi:hypothetical protein
MWRNVGFLIVTLAAAAHPAWLRGDPPPAPLDRHPELRRLSPTEEVWIDPAGRRVIVGAYVTLETGPIEVFACPEKTKEYEAVVATRSSARLVHAALLAIGLEPGRPVSFHPEYTAAAGPSVAVGLRWRDAAGNLQEARAQDWIRNAGTGKALDVDWVFAGSAIWKDPEDGTEIYEADQGDLVCVSNFPTATLDLPIESSQTNEELLFEAFPGRVPAKGTAIDIILMPANPPDNGPGSPQHPR